MTVKSIEAGKIRHWRLGEGERPMPTGGEEGDGQAEDGELHLPSTWRPSSISGSVIQRPSLIEVDVIVDVFSLRRAWKSQGVDEVPDTAEFLWRAAIA
jgi:hypothetical protein